MTEQPNQRPDETGPAGSSPPYEPPAFVPPQGSEVPPPPLYNADRYGASGQEQYGSAPYDQPLPYGQPGYYGMQPQPKGLSIASMVCGIAAVVVGFIMIPQIAAIITGHLALKREPAGKGMSITGLVLGYLCLLGYGFFWLLLIIGMTLASSTYGY